MSGILACPRRKSCRIGIEHAVRCGVTPETFVGEDQSIIFSAALATGPDYPLTVVLHFARHLLTEAGMWEGTAPRFWRNGLWSDDSLIDLATQYPGSSVVPMFAARLIDLHSTLVKIRQHSDYVIHLLRGVA